MKVDFKARCLPIALAVSMLAFGANANAESMKLRIADSLPTGHFFSEYATKYWMEEVTKATDGEVTFAYYPAEQLGKSKDMLALTQSGVTDIGYVVPSYISDKMPLSSVAELPGSVTNSCDATMSYLEMAQGDGLLAKNEFEPNKVRVLYAIVMPPYQLFTGKKPIENIDSIKGLKLRTAGGAMEATVRAFGGVPVKMAAPDMYESLSRGTVDGMLFPYASMISYDLVQISKYGTTGENFGSAVLTYVISEDKWQQIPEKIQDIMTEIGIKTTERACKLTDADSEKDIATMKEKGMQFITFNDADRKVINEKVSEISDEWAKEMDGRGKPGSDILKKYKELLAAK